MYNIFPHSPPRILYLIIIINMKAILSALLLTSAMVCGQENQSTIPTFKIDLSLPPQQRFVHVAKHYSKELVAVIDYVEAEIGFFGALVAQFVWGFDLLIPPFQPDRYNEIKGFMGAIGVPLWKGMAMNYIYEYGAWCTSIVARQEDGTIIHGRNLDFPLTPFLRNMTYKAEFYDGEHYRYEAMMFAGHMGVFTGFKKGGFSISENERTPTQQ
jgi:hypothetical protein